jgi:DNA-binding LytR/AlgR family response regulator
MLTCYVIDDESHAIKSLVSYIRRTPLLQLTGTSEDPLQALAYFQEKNHYPDITFLDIEMPQLSGIELSAFLKDKTAIVFTTAHPNFAIDAFELDISDYLLKPFSFERFLKCVSKIHERVSEKSKKTTADNFFYIQSESKGKFIKLTFEEILYIQSQKNYLWVVIPEKKYLTYLTLTEIEEKFPPFFLRISKSFIINTDKITHLEGDEVHLQQEKEALTIGSSYKDAFTEFMKTHLIKTKRFNH